MKPRECDDPCCRCHIAFPNSDGWLLGNRQVEAVHGSYARYVGGCRCVECRGAAAAYQRKRRARVSA